MRNFINIVENAQKLSETNVADFATARKELRPNEAILDHSMLATNSMELFRAFADLFALISKRASYYERESAPTPAGRVRSGYGAKLYYRETERLNTPPKDDQRAMKYPLVTRATDGPNFYHRFDVAYDQGGRTQAFVPASKGWKPSIDDVRLWQRHKNELNGLVSLIKQKVGPAVKKPEPAPEPAKVTKPVDNTTWEDLFGDSK